MRKGQKILIIASLIILFVVFLLGLFLKYKLELIDEPDKIVQSSDAGITDEQLKEEIGQMIMVGFRGITASEDSDISKIIKDVKIGGVILSDYDVPSKSFPRNIVSPEQTKKLISDIQKYSINNQLFVAVDAEGGNINRLKQQYEFLSIVSAQEMGQDKTLETTRKESVKLAEELKSLGFNMNLAPVVDLNINPASPVIGAMGRSFSSSQEEVFNNAKVFIQSHINNDIITVAKHFPGHGSSTEDSHLGMVDVTDTYKDEELFPYQKLNDDGILNAVMTAHIINKNIDTDYPATLSPIFLQNILRKQIGFEGVIISDDIQMSAISNNFEFDEALVMAINAGCDVINVYNNSSSGYDKDIAYKTRDAIFNAVKEGKIKEERITESYNRIINLKRKFKIIDSQEDDTSALKENQEQAVENNENEKKIEEIRGKNFELIGVPDGFTFGEAFDIAKNVEDLTGVRPAFLLSIFQEELSLEKFDLCYLTDFKTGEGVRISDGEVLPKTMHPQRDIPGFLSITKELGKNPSKTPITCPMSFGWGGAMGPADFIPSTWLLYEKRVESITGRPADPWNVQDAFLASGMYLADSGAVSKTRAGEWNAAMIYFSGSINSPYTWYANGALAIADGIQAEIDIIEKN